MVPLILTLESDCPWSTNFLDPEGDVLYETRTYFQGDTNYTAIRNDKEEIIGTLRWKETLPDEIMLKGLKFKSIAGWLKKSWIPMNYTVALKDDTGRGYVWTGNAPGLKLQLYTAEDKKKTAPIATYNNSYLISNTNSSGHPGSPQSPPTRGLATLELTERAQEIRDLVVTSFVVLEKGKKTEHGNMSARMAGGVAM
ncbi:hypothetical protein HWV62_7519 [Athelia sp. TMB]|nr:hypothetical protein HWV62_7519 [Athelia sp. TMB]